MATPCPEALCERDVRGLVRRRGTVKATASPPTEPEGMQVRVFPSRESAAAERRSLRGTRFQDSGAADCKRSEETYEAPSETVKPISINSSRVFT